MRDQLVPYVEANPKLPTYKKAREVLLAALKASGWDVVTWSRGSTLKTPYATHDTGRRACRVWFKAQAMYWQSGGAPFSLGAASSTHMDIRQLAAVVDTGKWQADDLTTYLVSKLCERATDNPALPVLEQLDLAGERVALAINLHRCRAGKPIPAGAACFSVRDKPSSGSKVRGYLHGATLRDVEFVVNQRSLERIQKKESREVCCFVVGTVVRPRCAEIGRTKPAKWVPIRFNPFRAPCFTRPDGKCAVSAELAVLAKKEVAAYGVRTG